MSKILIVGLLQVVLAQNYPDARPYHRTNTNTGRQFYYQDAENRNLEVPRQDMRFRAEDFSNQYAIAEDPRSYIPNGGVNNGGVSNIEGKKRRVTVHRKNGQYKTNDGLDPILSDVGSQSNTHRVKSDLIGTEYAKDNSQTPDNQVRTNKNSSEDNDVSRANENIELTTVPVLILTSATLKTNPNINSNYADNETSNDNFGEVKHNSNAPIFAEMDNKKPESLDRATTDNEVNRYNKNGAGGKGEGDRWIWDGATNSNVTSTEKATTVGDLDDRISFNGDGCPAGEAKVKGICTPRH